MYRYFLLATILIGSFFVFTQAHAATTYYVDGSSTGCNGAPCSNSNNGITEATAFKDPDGCINKPLAPGDTCLIKNGTYRGTGGSALVPAWDFAGLNGTAGNEIVVKNYPGHTPLLCADAGGSCATCAVAAGNRDNVKMSYIRFDGLRIQGEFQVSGVSVNTPASHVTLTNSEITNGGGEGDNAALIRPQYITNGQFDHLYIHNAASCANANRTISGFWTWRDVDTIYEYNTMDDSVGTSMAYGFLLKECPIRNIYRYNRFVGTGFRHTVQEGADGTCNGLSGSTQLYGNVFENTSMTTEDMSDDVSFHHNTISNGSLDWYAEDQALLRSIVKDNIIASAINGPDCEQSAGCNVVLSTKNWAVKSGYTWDYNVYTPGGPGWAADQYGPTASFKTTLAAWQSASGLDSHSSALSCAFMAGSDTNFHINSGSCLTLSSTGGQVGAYGVTSCVGYLCGASAPDTTPPAAPSGVIVQ